ncbi:phosphate signaling complex protein PhoU [endosymbiont of unidentified scaly snail isolate Monju]|uniref:phosphate signaling complex protein PhoU n=1 Tax=endosymbiont of unidentified scaly snail isolate Monju TaxID=1248727 RepID=UPI0003891CA4|nr:phosphate signaling complex protein PhoU [endosymbiont of unidentified scaly snail isolate Monju]BAN69960.1 phosphate transport system protein [endosymbiont of unidentified scaly snail isolate Monju]
MNGTVSNGHILRGFDKDMRKLRKRVLKMAGLVRGQMERLQLALGHDSTEQARQVIEGDRPIDLQEVKVDSFIVSLLARRAPVGRDLRYVVATSRIVTELERLGDEMTQIARVLCQESLPESGCDGHSPRSEVQHLMGHLIMLLDTALRAYEEDDARQSEVIVAGELPEQIDLRNRLKYLVECVFDNRQDVAEAVNFMLVLKSLDRGKRHIDNIAEHVIYLVTGEDIRHQ